MDDIARELVDVESKEGGRLLDSAVKDSAGINVKFYRDMVRFQTAGGGQTGDLASVRDYYRSLEPARLVVVGAPGSGKTVLALHLLVSLLEDPRTGDPVPVRMSLSGFDTSQPLERWLVRELTARFSQPARAGGRRADAGPAGAARGLDATG